jgi:hypothetical protein
VIERPVLGRGAMKQHWFRIAKESAIGWALVVMALGAHGEDTSGVIEILPLVLFLRRRLDWRMVGDSATEWRLTSGASSRASLARWWIMEILMIALLRAAALGAMYAVLGGDQQTGVFARFTNGVSSPASVFCAAALSLIVVQTGIGLLANASCSNRMPRAVRETDLLFPDGNLRAIGRSVGAILVLLALPFVAIEFGASLWALAILAALYLALLGWLLPEVEPTGGSNQRSGAERVAASAHTEPARDFAWLSAEALRPSGALTRSGYAPILSLAWDGMKPLAKVCLFVSVAIMIVKLSFHGDYASFHERGLWEQILYFGPFVLPVFLVRDRSFYWKSVGQSAEFLAASGVGLGTLRRVELLLGAVAAMLVSFGGHHSYEGFFDDRYISIQPLVPCLLLLELNRMHLGLRAFPTTRVKNLLSVVFCAFLGASLLDPGHNTWLAVVGLLLTLSIGLWIVAYVRASDEEGLRDVELDLAQR